jgi:NTP pyrophosphatase (non-canonical NTP hydrolase)
VSTERASLFASARVDSDREVIYLHIDAERDRQDAKWGGIPGVERRDDHTYAAVLTEEVGECCKAWLERDTKALREELVQTAAVAVAWIEELDRGGAVPRSKSAPFAPATHLTHGQRDDWGVGS